MSDTVIMMIGSVLTVLLVALNVGSIWLLVQEAKQNGEKQ